jgi:hypothetical protein
MSWKVILKHGDELLASEENGSFEELKERLNELERYCRSRCGRYRIVGGCDECSIKERKDAIMRAMRNKDNKYLKVGKGGEA